MKPKGIMCRLAVALPLWSAVTWLVYRFDL